MIILETERLILRDFQRDDIEKRVYWKTVECEWMKWDAPWENKVLQGDELLEFVDGLTHFADMISLKQDNDIRYAFEIVIRETEEYIGWISCYCIDNNYKYTDCDGKYAFGIDIPSRGCRGKGFGFEAFRAVIEYLLSKGIFDIYTQTWSGNKPMMELAKKLGFKEVYRLENCRIVNDEIYDAVTFRYM